MRSTKWIRCFLLGLLCLQWFSLFAQETEAAQRARLQNAKTAPERLEILLELSKTVLAKQPKEALTLSEEALAIAKELKNETAVAQSYAAMGAANTYQAKHQEAVKLLHTGLAHARRAKATEVQAQILSQLARDKRFLSELDSAIYFAEAALALQEKADIQLYRSKNYFEIGVAYDLKGELEPAMSHLLSALEAAENLKDDKQIALIFNSLGIVNRSAGNYDKALEYYQGAKNTYEKLNSQRDIANVLHNMGDVYMHLNDFDKGINYTLQGKAIREEIEDYYGLGYSYQNLAYAYFNHYKDYKKALEADSLAYEARAKVSDQSGMAISLNDMAWNLFKLGETATALRKSKEALAIARQLGARAIEKNCLNLIAQILAAQGNYEQAMTYQQQYYELKDSLFNEEKNRVIQELQVKYETTKKEQQLQENQLVIERRTMQRNWLLAVAILAGLLALSVFLGFRSRLRYNQRLQAQRIRELEQTQKIIALNAMMQGQEEERRRVAKDLHDGLGGLLSSIKHHFRAVSEQSQQLNALPVYQKTNTMLDEAHEEVRRIAHNMMPDALAKLGLVAAIEDLAESYRGANALQISVQHFDWNERLEETLEINLFRIVQELLQNIAKHAQATQVFIQLSQFDDTLTMTIEDNGIGFDLSKAKTNGGIGLKSMESRVAYLGGTMTVETAPDKGVLTIIQIPILL